MKDKLLISREDPNAYKAWAGSADRWSGEAHFMTIIIQSGFRGAQPIALQGLDHSLLAADLRDGLKIASTILKQEM
jgi:hypothetical protein